MIRSLDINQQNALFAAFSQLDSYETDTPGVDGPKVVRVPYKLGASRRALVKNMNAIKASLLSYEEAHKALFKEIFPDQDEDAVVTREKEPEKFLRFQAEQKKMLAAKDDIDLLTFSEAVLYPADPNAREFPAPALVTLDEHGLIEGEGTAAA